VIQRTQEIAGVNSIITNYFYFIDQMDLVRQCHLYAQDLMTEKEQLRAELDAIKARIEATALQDMEEEEEEADSNGKSFTVKCCTSLLLG